MILPSLVQRALLLVWVLLGLGLPACRATPDTQSPPSVATDERGPTYSIVGLVENPGAKYYPGDLTLFEAIMQAKPRSDAGNLGRVRLIRADPRDSFDQVLDLSNLFKSGDSTFNVHVHEGDVIDVQSAIEEPSSSSPR